VLTTVVRREIRDALQAAQNREVILLALAQITSADDAMNDVGRFLETSDLLAPHEYTCTLSCGRVRSVATSAIDLTERIKSDFCSSGSSLKVTIDKMKLEIEDLVEEIVKFTSVGQSAEDAIGQDEALGFFEKFAAYDLLYDQGRGTCNRCDMASISRREAQWKRGDCWRWGNCGDQNYDTCNGLLEVNVSKFAPSKSWPDVHKGPYDSAGPSRHGGECYCHDKLYYVGAQADHYDGNADNKYKGGCIAGNVNRPWPNRERDANDKWWKVVTENDDGDDVWDGPRRAFSHRRLTCSNDKDHTECEDTCKRKGEKLKALHKMVKAYIAGTNLLKGLLLRISQIYDHDAWSADEANMNVDSFVKACNIDGHVKVRARYMRALEGLEAAAKLDLGCDEPLEIDWSVADRLGGNEVAAWSEAVKPQYIGCYRTHRAAELNWQSPILPPNDLLVCSNSCGGPYEINLIWNGHEYPNNGICDDGGDGATYSHCPLGTDCNDCGLRTVLASVPPANASTSPRRIMTLEQANWACSRRTNHTSYAALSATAVTSQSYTLLPPKTYTLLSCPQPEGLDVMCADDLSLAEQVEDHQCLGVTPSAMETSSISSCPGLSYGGRTGQPRTPDRARAGSVEVAAVYATRGGGTSKLTRRAGTAERAVRLVGKEGLAFEDEQNSADLAIGLSGLLNAPYTREILSSSNGSTFDPNFFFIQTMAAANDSMLAETYSLAQNQVMYDDNGDQQCNAPPWCRDGTPGLTNASETQGLMNQTNWNSPSDGPGVRYGWRFVDANDGYVYIQSGVGPNSQRFLVDRQGELKVERVMEADKLHDAHKWLLARTYKRLTDYGWSGVESFTWGKVLGMEAFHIYSKAHRLLYLHQPAPGELKVGLTDPSAVAGACSTHVNSSCAEWLLQPMTRRSLRHVTKLGNVSIAPFPTWSDGEGETTKKLKQLHSYLAPLGNASMAVGAYARRMTNTNNLVVTDARTAGQSGGWCICPDGSTYLAGLELNITAQGSASGSGCSTAIGSMPTLACDGGTSDGFCINDLGIYSHRRVTCDAGKRKNEGNPGRDVLAWSNAYLQVANQLVTSVREITADLHGTDDQRCRSLETALAEAKASPAMPYVCGTCSGAVAEFPFDTFPPRSGSLEYRDCEEPLFLGQNAGPVDLIKMHQLIPFWKHACDALDDALVALSDGYCSQPQFTLPPSPTPPPQMPPISPPSAPPPPNENLYIRICTKTECQPLWGPKRVIGFANVERTFFAEFTDSQPVEEFGPLHGPAPTSPPDFRDVVLVFVHAGYEKSPCHGAARRQNTHRARIERAPGWSKQDPQYAIVVRLPEAGYFNICLSTYYQPWLDSHFIRLVTTQLVIHTSFPPPLPPAGPAPPPLPPASPPGTAS